MDYLIRLLELGNISDRLIGSDERDGISREQRKRTNTAVQLAADPAMYVYIV